jgi:sugar phosphate isomerase/epimerase
MNSPLFALKQEVPTPTTVYNHHMQLAIFAKTFAGPTLADILTAVRAAGVAAVQFNLSCVGLPTLPVHLDRAQCATIRVTFAAHGVRMVALSATGNLIHPDMAVRTQIIDRITQLIPRCVDLGVNTVTISTGTGDPDDLWRAHPANTTQASWDAMVTAVRAVVDVAARHGVSVAFEPEPGNVVQTVQQARMLLDQISSPYLKVVLDVANLLTPATVAHQHTIIAEAIQLLGSDIAVVHAKELSCDGQVGGAAAGSGVVDFGYLLTKLAAINYAGPVVIHGLDAKDAPRSVAHLQQLVVGLSPTAQGVFSKKNT